MRLSLIFLALTIGLACADNGWIAQNENWTYAGADGPIFYINTNGGHEYSDGMRINLTQNGNISYFIITNINETVLSCYGGSDYKLTNDPILRESYSMMKAPLGFPLDPAKWSIVKESTTDTFTTYPAPYQWYPSFNCTIPQGSWRVSYSVLPYIWRVNSGFSTWCCGLSTSPSTFSNPEYHILQKTYLYAGTVAPQVFVWTQKSFTMDLAKKTNWYVIYSTAQPDIMQVGVHNAAINGRIEAECAYL
jgi:hypothetical protein